MYAQEILETIAISTGGFALLGATYTIIRGWNLGTNILCHWLMIRNLPALSSLGMWNANDILSASASRQKAFEGTEKGWCFTLGFGQEKCTSMCIISICVHFFHQIYFNYFLAFACVLFHLCCSEINVSIIIFNCKSSMKMKRVLSLQ